MVVVVVVLAGGGGGGEDSDGIWRETGPASDSRLVSELSEDGG